MLFLIVLLLGGLVASFLVKSQATAVLTGLRVGLCVLALALSLVRCQHTRTVSPVTLTGDRHYLVGWKLGQFLAEELPEAATVVVVQADSDAPGVVHANASSRRGLDASTPGKHFTWAYPGEDTPPENGGETMTMGRSAALRLLEAAQAADALVALDAIPLDALAKHDLPPVYLLDLYNTQYWRKHMDSGLVRVAVVPRTGPGTRPSGKVSGPPQKRFAESYTVVTAASAPE